MNESEARRLFELRNGPASELAGQADAVAAACHAMAVRFHRGGKLVVFGTGGASTDAQHVAVEFVHPVIVGKRALPAISLTTDVATVTGIAERAGMAAIFAHQIRYLATTSVVQTQFGIKPYSGFLGALKVRDAVEVRAEVALPDGGETA